MLRDWLAQRVGARRILWSAQRFDAWRAGFVARAALS